MGSTITEKLHLIALVFKKGPKTKEKASFVWDILLNGPFREQETLKYHTHIFKKLTLSRTSSRAISQHKNCRLGNLQAMHLSCTVPCKSQILILFLQGALAAVAFPHLSQRFSSASFPRPSHNTIQRFVNCEKQMFSNHFPPIQAQERLEREKKKKEKSHLSKYFSPPYWPYSPRVFPTSNDKMYPVNFSPLPSRRPWPVHPPLRAAAPRLSAEGAPAAPGGGVPAAPALPSGLRSAEPGRSPPSPAPSLRSSPGQSEQAAGRRCPPEGTAELPAPRRLPQPSGDRSPHPGPHRPLQEQQQQHFAKSHPTPERAG